ncbi:MAG: PAS domain S-box protein [Nitrospirae bacterium]|nr:PAS domain S-box protein [Nitrospirota bacterium]
MKLKYRFLLSLLAISIVPLCISAFIIYGYFKKTVTKSIENELQAIASIQKNRVNNLIERSTEPLKAIANNNLLKSDIGSYMSGDIQFREKIINHLNILKDTFADMQEIAVFNPEGKMLASTNPGMTVAKYINRQDTQGIINDRFNCGFPDIVKEENGSIVIRSYCRLTTDGKLMGMVFIGWAPRQLFGIAGSYIGLGTTGETVVAERDSQGDALFITPLRFDKEAALVRKISKDNVSAPIVQALAKKEIFSGGGTDYRNKRVFTATRYIEKTDWGLAVKIDESEVMEPLLRIRNLAIFAIISILVLIVIIATCLSEHITRSLAMVTRMAYRVSQGDMSVSLEISSDDEVGTLCKGFNKMTREIAGVQLQLRGKISELEVEMQERLRAELELQKSRDRYLRLSEATREGIIISDKGVILDVNEQMATMLGYEPGELTGKEVPGMVAPEQSERIRNIISSGYEEPYETIGLKKDGTPVILEVCGKRLSYEGTYMRVAAVRDVTMRKHREKALIRAGQEWERTFDAIPDLLMILDKNYTVVKMNKAMANRLDITTGDAIGMTCYELMHNGHESPHNCPYKQMLEDGLEHTIETYKTRIKGYFLVTVTPLYDTDGTIYGAVHLARDVSSLKAIQNRLHEENEKNKAILEAINYSVTILDLNFRIIDQNRIMDTVFGECVGEYCYKAYRNKDAICDACPVCETFKDGATHKGVGKLITPHGGTVYYEYTVAPVRDASGNIVAAMEITKDISERKRMENEILKTSMQLEELNKSLEEKVKDETDKRMQKEQLLIQQSKMASMGEMIAAIAHQWKQPLNSLGLFIQDVRDAYEFGELDSAYIDSVVNNSMSEIHFMSKTIDEFRNFFKPSTVKETFDLIKVASGVFSMLSAQLKTNLISYRLTCHPHNKTFYNYADVIPCDAALITTYKNQLAHVILNIINNAKDAIIERRLRGFLGVTDEGMIGVDYYKEEGVLRLEISDNGGGIPAEIMDRIFEPYFTTKKSDEGTGIGLYMAKIIVNDKLGGKIHLRNVDGGAVFTLEFKL